MYPWETAKYRLATRTEPRDSVLTPEEIARLAMVRARYEGHPEYLELGLDERRLVFARWLVAKGALSDDL